jgi:hypothetical protein
MKSRSLVATVGKAVAASALICGILGVVGVSAASAQTSVALYVKPAADGGSNANGNTCTLAANPCATIGYALSQFTVTNPAAVGSTINLAKGTYNSTGATDFFAGLSQYDSNVTITGAGKKTVVAPQNCSQLGRLTAADGVYPIGSAGIVVFNASEDGISVENMDLNGAGVSSCAGYEAGVWITASTTGDAVVGDTIQSGATYGILTDGDADSTIISNVLSPVLCTAKVTGPNTGLNAGWTTPANLKVNKVPSCAVFTESSHGNATGIFVNGIGYCTSFSATAKTLVITGTVDPSTGCATGGDAITASAGQEIAKGATVVYNTSVAPFIHWGIACNSPINATVASTDCAISDNSVTAGGTALTDYPAAGCSLLSTGVPPIGIVVTGEATADVDGNSVSDVSDALVGCPEAGETTNDGIGIGLIPNASHDSAGDTNVGVNTLGNTPTGNGNKVSSNGYGITVEGGANVASYQVNSNTATGNADAGVLLANLNAAGPGSLDTAVTSNSASGSLTGEGFVLDGVEGETFGGALASQGNSASGDGVGIVLTGPSNGNTVQNNSSTGNELYGLLVVGQYQPEEIQYPVSDPAAPFASLSQDVPLSSGGLASNTFNGNTWTGNSAGSPLVDGANVMDGTGWAGGCSGEAGDCPVLPNPLTYEGANQSFSSSYPGTATISLSVCNNNANSEVLPVGTEITFYNYETGDGGTFFVTKDAIITGNVGCTGPFYNLDVQALNPEEVGTITSPTGQAYILGTGDSIGVNVNGVATAGASLNLYGKSAKANSCTPAGVNGTGDVFGSSNGSSTLNASSGGVYAGYTAC